MTGNTAPVRAAGGAVWRRSAAGDLEVLLVHRPRYDDWTLPKGKCEEGEEDLACALREVEEETGLSCAVGDELPSTHYVDNQGRPKSVRYWAMQPLSDPTQPGELLHEVDEVAWLPIDLAKRRLSYGFDNPVLEALNAIAT